jgi:hypothetical protein
LQASLPLFLSFQLKFMKKVLITGATGATGGNAIKKLLELKVPVRALVHQVDERSKKLSSQGVEIVQGDLSDFEAVNEALKGITTAYFVFPVTVPGLLEATAVFAQAALEQSVAAIVNMSQISARRIAKSRAAQNHWIAERLLDRSGIPVTHLRPTFFAEWLTYVSESIRKKNMFPLPFGDARYAPITAEDQGRVISWPMPESELLRSTRRTENRSQKTMINLSKETIENLKSKVKGQIVLPSDSRYEEVRQIWNAMIERRPALIVRCAEADDVPQAIAFTRENGLEISIRGAGHNIAGNALCDNGVNPEEK